MPKGGSKKEIGRERESENVSQSEKLFCHTARLVSPHFPFAPLPRACSCSCRRRRRNFLTFSAQFLVHFLPIFLRRRENEMSSFLFADGILHIVKRITHVSLSLHIGLNSFFVRLSFLRRHFGSFHVILCEQFQFNERALGLPKTFMAQFHFHLLFLYQRVNVLVFFGSSRVN